MVPQTEKQQIKGPVITVPHHTSKTHALVMATIIPEGIAPANKAPEARLAPSAKELI